MFPDRIPHKMQYRKILLCILLLGRSALNPAVAATPDECRAHLEQAVRQHVLAQNLPAAQFVLRQRNGMTVNLTFGEAHPGAALAGDQPLQIASLSKILTGLAVLDANTQGVLPLDQRLATALGMTHAALGKGVQDIRIRDLLGHRSGLARAAGLDEMLKPAPRCPGQLETLLSEPLATPSGSRFEYSNTGYCILGEALRRRTGRPLAKQVHQAVAQRIGPSSIRPYVADGTVIHHASPDDLRDNPATVRFDYAAMLASGGYQSNAGDLSRLLAAAFPSETLHLLDTAPADCLRATGLRNCHGLIFHVFDDEDGQRMFWRDGSLPGISALAVIPGHAEWNWVLLATRRHRDGLRLNENLLRAIGKSIRQFEACESADRQKRPGTKR